MQIYMYKYTYIIYCCKALNYQLITTKPKI